MMTMIASFRKTSDDDPTLAGAAVAAVVDAVILGGSCGWWVY